jgi:hypothetical protein
LSLLDPNTTELEPLDLSLVNRIQLDKNITSTPIWELSSRPNNYNNNTTNGRTSENASRTREDEDEFQTPKGGKENLSEFPEFSKLYKYLLTNKDSFNINQDGQVLRGNTVIRDSTLANIVYHYFHAGPGIVSPTGYSRLSKKLANDPYAKGLLAEFRKRGTEKKKKELVGSSHLLKNRIVVLVQINGARKLD